MLFDVIHIETLYEHPPYNRYLHYLTAQENEQAKKKEKLKNSKWCRGCEVSHA